MKSRSKRRKIRYSNARDSRGVSYKYFPVDDVKSVAVKAGRCYKCRTITTDFCFGCSKYVCKNHSEKRKDEVWCVECVSKGITRSTHLSYVG